MVLLNPIVLWCSGGAPTYRVVSGFKYHHLDNIVTHALLYHKVIILVFKPQHHQDYVIFRITKKKKISSINVYL